MGIKYYKIITSISRNLQAVILISIIAGSSLCELPILDYVHSQQVNAWDREITSGTVPTIPTNQTLARTLIPDLPLKTIKDSNIPIAQESLKQLFAMADSYL